MTKPDKKITLLLLFVILLTGAGLRLWELGANPPALFRDEAEKGWSAWCLAKTGGVLYFANLNSRPILGFNRLPLFIDVFGVHTSATYQYLAAPFTAVGGLNEWTTRLPAALAGIATILLTCLLTLQWTKKRSAALAAAFILAICPWHIIFSRWAAQGILIPLFVTAALLLFDLGIKRKAYWLPASAFLFALAFYTYAPARIFVPILGVALGIIYRKELLEEKRWSLAGAGLFLLICVPLFIYYVSGGRDERFARLSVFGEGRGVFGGLWLFFKNYLSHFSPRFLFLSGDEQLRHSLPGLGQLHAFEAPLLIYGIWRLSKNREKSHKLLLVWLLAFPVAAAHTKEGVPHALRSIVALPMTAVIGGIAASAILEKVYAMARVEDQRIRGRKIVGSTKNVNALFVIIMLVIFLNVGTMAHNLFRIYPAESAPEWQYGLKQALRIVQENDVPPEKAFISGRIAYAPYLVMAYDRIDPRRLREEGLAGLGYQFPPPNVPPDAVWNRAPSGASLIFYPGEWRGKRPDYTIRFPSVNEGFIKGDAALNVYVKK